MSLFAKGGKQMGSSYTIWHVDVSDLSEKTMVSMVETLLQKEGYAPCEDSTPECKTIFLLHKPGTRWMTLWDQDTSTLSIKDLKKRTQQLSKHFQTTAIASMVYASDVTAMYVHSASLNRQDLVVLDPGQGYAAEIGYNPRTCAGKPSIWRAVLGCDAHALRGLWDQEETFAEEKLSKIHKLLGLDDPSNSILICEQQPAVAPLGYTLTKRTFKLPHKKETAKLQHLGPPIIDWKSGTLYVVWNEQTVFSFLNRGGPETGLYFFLESPLFETHDFLFSEVTIMRRKIFRGNINRFHPEDYLCQKAHLQKEVSTDCKSVRMVARFDDFPIPEGLPAHLESSLSPQKAMDAWYEREILVYVTIYGDEQLQSDISAFLVPIHTTEEAKHRGQFAQLIDRNRLHAKIQEGMKPSR